MTTSSCNNYFRILSKLLLISVTLSYASCSILDSSDNQEESSKNIQSAHSISSLRLYLAKASLTKTEFEQYSLSGNTLFFECGLIRGARNLPNTQAVVNLEETDSANLTLLGMEILGRAAVANPLSLAEPGDLKGFADSGKVILNLTTKDNKTAEVKTGLEEVSEPATTLERGLHKLSQALRAEVKKVKGDDGLCGNENFFGIE